MLDEALTRERHRAAIHERRADEAVSALKQTRLQLSQAAEALRDALLAKEALLGGDEDSGKGGAFGSPFVSAATGPAAGEEAEESGAGKGDLGRLAAQAAAAMVQKVLIYNDDEKQDRASQQGGRTRSVAFVETQQKS